MVAGSQYQCDITDSSTALDSVKLGTYVCVCRYLVNVIVILLLFSKCHYISDNVVAVGRQDWDG